ncbi:hypothetical protein HN51_024318 [Arachis hypogaea]
MAFIIIFLIFIASQTFVNIPLTTTTATPLSSESDKIALLALKDKLSNGDPHALPSWNESLHFCAWEGAT